jgi:hypothetical protein
MVENSFVWKNQIPCNLSRIKRKGEKWVSDRGIGGVEKNYILQKIIAIIDRGVCWFETLSDFS